MAKVMPKARKERTKFDVPADREPLPAAQLNLAYLEAEMGRIDLLIRLAVAHWQQAGRDPQDAFRGLVVGREEVEGLLAQPLGGTWGDLAPKNGPTGALDQAAVGLAAQVNLNVQQVAALAAQQGVPLRLHELAQAFDLDPFDVDALLICLAPALDLRYEQIYSYLQNDINRKYPTVDLVLHLLGGTGMARLSELARFAPDVPLLRHRLIDYVQEPGQVSPSLLAQPLKVDQTVVNWLLCLDRPTAELGPYVRLESVIPPPTHLLDPELAATLAHVAGLRRPLILFHGPDRTAQEEAARVVATHLKARLLLADATRLADQNFPDQALHLVLRDARLHNAVAFVHGWDVFLDENTAALPLLESLLAHPGPLIVGSRLAWQPRGMARTRPIAAVEFGLPTYSHRQALWRHYLDEYQLADTELDPVELAGQFTLTTGQIRDAVATGHDRALLRGASVARVDLFAAARSQSGTRLAEMARKIVPRFGWEDIILPDDQIQILRELVAMVRGRSKVLDEWGLGRKLASSAAVTVLFAGPPGTGKTMAAEVIAQDLGLDLYKIDLSSLVSKYIGETEKNLERVFSEAESSNAILFFDEADAIFGKRSGVKDAHDRYANLEISYLLQRMEAYDGVTILATNLRSNLDDAFLRRLQFAVDLPFPDEKHRLRIWQTLFPSNVPRADDVDLEELAKRLKLAGGNIRNILLSATYLAAADQDEITMQHLLHATRREFQKMGRLMLDG